MCFEKRIFIFNCITSKFLNHHSFCDCDLCRFVQKNRKYLYPIFEEVYDVVNSEGQFYFEYNHDDNDFDQDFHERENDEGFEDHKYTDYIGNWTIDDWISFMEIDIYEKFADNKEIYSFIDQNSKIIEQMLNAILNYYNSITSDMRWHLVFHMYGYEYCHKDECYSDTEEDLAIIPKKYRSITSNAKEEVIDNVNNGEQWDI